MKQVRYRASGTTVNFDQSLRLGKGGEGVVYEVPNRPDLVAKIYHPSQVTLERGRKLEVMLNNPPDDPMRPKGMASIAWPTDLLEHPGTRQVVGFVMPRVVKGMRPIFEYYDPKARIRNNPAFSYDYLVRTAVNLVSAVGALHAKRYVIGDLNESNVMVGDNALVTLVDTDSFQVTDPLSGATYRCPVGKEDFTPPELQGKHFGRIDRRQEHDLFGLAALLYHLLLENSQPFGGRYKGAGEPPEYGERIAKGYFLHCRRRRVPFLPNAFSPPFDLLHPELVRLFVECFEDGHARPAARPDADRWHQALREAERALVRCGVNGQHWFGGHLQSCPWCERARMFKVDPFPSRGQAHAAAAAFNVRGRAAAAGRPGWRGARVFAPRPAPPSPSVNSFYASPVSPAPGQSCTLWWNVSNAQSVVINCGIGPVPPSGSVVVAPAVNTTYRIKARGAGGAATGTATVRITKPSPIISFSASSQSVHLCQPVTLRWQVAQTHSAHINHKVGPVANSGQIVVSPGRSTTYVLTARGGGPPVRQKLRVAVTLPPLPGALNSPHPLFNVSNPLPGYAALLHPQALLRSFITLALVMRLRIYNPMQGAVAGLMSYIPLRAAHAVSAPSANHN